MNNLNITLKEFAKNIDSYTDYLLKTKRYTTYEECFQHAKRFYLKMINDILEKNNKTSRIDSFNIKRTLH
jgi:hypothetical protein